MKTNLKKEIEWLGNPRNAITVTVLLAIAGVAIWLIVRKVKSTVSDVKASSLSGTSSDPTNYNTLANQAYQAMKGLGTDESALERVLSQITSNTAYDKLRQAYLLLDKRNAFTDLDTDISKEGTTKELIKWRAILDANGVTNYSF